MTTVISIVGTSHSGKTTLLAKVITLLKEKGFSVCVIKHSDQILTYKDVDHKGKDTYTFSEAGADEVWLTSPHLTYHIHPEETSLHAMIKASTADFIFTEGFKNADTKKIVIKKPGEHLYVKGEILCTIEGEYNAKDILEILIH